VRGSTTQRLCGTAEGPQEASDAVFRYVWLDMLVQQYQGVPSKWRSWGSRGAVQLAVVLAEAIETSQTAQIDEMHGLC
jgi:hypothetical protein